MNASWNGRQLRFLGWSDLSDGVVDRKRLVAAPQRDGLRAHALLPHRVVHEPEGFGGLLVDAEEGDPFPQTTRLTAGKLDPDPGFIRERPHPRPQARRFASPLRRASRRTGPTRGVEALDELGAREAREGLHVELDVGEHWSVDPCDLEPWRTVGLDPNCAARIGAGDLGVNRDVVPHRELDSIAVQEFERPLLGVTCGGLSKAAERPTNTGLPTAPLTASFAWKSQASSRLRSGCSWSLTRNRSTTR